MGRSSPGRSRYTIMEMKELFGKISLTACIPYWLHVLPLVLYDIIYFKENLIFKRDLISEGVWHQMLIDISVPLRPAHICGDGGYQLLSFLCTGIILTTYYFLSENEVMPGNIKTVEVSMLFIICHFSLLCKIKSRRCGRLSSLLTNVFVRGQYAIPYRTLRPLSGRYARGMTITCQNARTIVAL